MSADLTPEEREAEDAFWREQEAGSLPRDRGGYVAQGFRAGFLAARAQAAPLTAEAIARRLMEQWGCGEGRIDEQYGPECKSGAHAPSLCRGVCQFAIDTAEVIARAQATAEVDRSLVPALSQIKTLIRDLGDMACIGCRNNTCPACRLAAEVTVQVSLAADPPQATAATRADTASEALVVQPIDGPFPMPGFEGCTDRNPDVCACATDEDVACAACGEVIEPGTPAYSRTEGQPWANPDDKDQDWTILTWHASCDTRSAALGGDPDHSHGRQG